MKKYLFLAVCLVLSNAASARTDHYYLRDGNHVRHLKISRVDGNISVSADVDFEPNANEKESYPCTAEISGEAKSEAENKVVLKKHAESTASYCELTIELSAVGASVKQSEGCDNFVAGICQFATEEGKELVKLK